MDYKELYFQLFNNVTDAIVELEKSNVITIEILKARKILTCAQIKTEALYINEE